MFQRPQSEKSKKSIRAYLSQIALEIMWLRILIWTFDSLYRLKLDNIANGVVHTRCLDNGTDYSCLVGGLGVDFTLTCAFGMVDLELKLFRFQRISNGNIICNVDTPRSLSLMASTRPLYFVVHICFKEAKILNIITIAKTLRSN